MSKKYTDPEKAQRIKEVIEFNMNQSKIQREKGDFIGAMSCLGMASKFRAELSMLEIKPETE